MEALFSCLSAPVTECAKPLSASAYLRIKHIFDFQSNFVALETKLTALVTKKKHVIAEIENDEKDGKTRTLEISKWLQEIQGVEPRVRVILGEKLDGCCCSCSLRCRLGKEVADKLEKVNQLLGNCDPPYTTDAQVKAVEHVPGTSITDQETAKKNLAQLQEYLRDDKVGTIAMLGMGGIGKTTLITNLNNELEGLDSSSQPFSIVIWVTVSKDWSVEKIQQRIFERLKMPKKEHETTVGNAIRLSNRLRLEKKFIVILDDVWEKINLDMVGIPPPKTHPGSKIILTTRLQDVCNDMMTHVTFNVAVLEKKESWDLFRKIAGDDSGLSDEIIPIAKQVTRECGGLPLAIITVGSAMRGKSIEKWNRALKALQKSCPVPCIHGIDKNLFLPLKLSYDSLEGVNVKPCFLYCCLYPEDHSIEINELLQCWEAEGLVDAEEDLEEVNSTGMALIDNLIDSCLLQNGSREDTVRMHDVVRDVAIWIASNLEDGERSFIRPGYASPQIPGVETWGSYKRVSFMYGKIETLLQSVPECSQVSSLLLQGNDQLRRVPVGFLRGFPALRVLDLSETSIISLPPIEQLGELRALFLRSCSLLREFPPLEGLSRLQVLDLSNNNRIEMSPQEAAVKLREVSFLEHLHEFYIDLYCVPSVTFGDSTWLKRLRRFRICIGSTTDTDPIQHNERIVYLCDVKSSSEAILVFWNYASALVLVRSQCITEMWTGYSAVNLSCLKSLTVDNCSWTGSTVADDAQPDDLVLFPSLEVLTLRRIKNLDGISKLLIHGRNIKVIEIRNCHDMKNLFLSESLHKLQKLEKIYVSSCHNLMDIIVGSAVKANALGNLQTMELKELPRLKNICQQVMSWPGLKWIEVKDCPHLKKLPLSFARGNVIQSIKGEQEWWNQLQCENEDTKARLQPYFQPS